MEERRILDTGCLVPDIIVGEPSSASYTSRISSEKRSDDLLESGDTRARESRSQDADSDKLLGHLGYAAVEWLRNFFSAQFVSMRSGGSLQETAEGECEQPSTSFPCCRLADVAPLVIRPLTDVRHQVRLPVLGLGTRDSGLGTWRVQDFAESSPKTSHRETEEIWTRALELFEAIPLAEGALQPLDFM